LNLGSLADGPLSLTADAADSAGNHGSATTAVTKDTVAPAVAIATATNPITATNATNVTVAGTAEPGVQVAVTATNGTQVTAATTVTADGSGAWQVSGYNVSSLPDGTVTFTATATDAAGNKSTATRSSTKAAS
jgi:hypothetical protein